MTSDRIKELHRAAPFRPFTLQLADGNSVRVKSPEFMWMTPGGRTIFVSQGTEAVEIIDLLLVTKVSIGNGERRPRRGGPT